MEAASGSFAAKPVRFAAWEFNFLRESKKDSRNRSTLAARFTKRNFIFGVIALAASAAAKAPTTEAAVNAAPNQLGEQRNPCRESPLAEET